MKRWILAMMGCAIASLQAAELRTWTSKDGAATLSASFHKIDGDQVTLVLENGRSQTIDRKFFSDADLEWIAQTAAAGSSEAVKSAAAIPAALEGRLIDSRGKKFDLTAKGAAPKYYLFYYSASWCGPCQAFTPQLERFYRKMKARNADFEIVLFPNDRSADDALAYMKDHRMPWPGLEFDQAKAAGIPRNKWGYIPAMVLVDAEGNRVLEVNDDLSRPDFLEQAEDLLSKNKETAAN